MPLPFALPPIEVSLHSHVHFAQDSSIGWLRRTLLEMFRVPAPGADAQEAGAARQEDGGPRLQEAGAAAAGVAAWPQRQ